MGGVGTAGTAGVGRSHVVPLSADVAGVGSRRGAKRTVAIIAHDLGAASAACIGGVAEGAGETGGGGVAEGAVGHGRADVCSAGRTRGSDVVASVALAAERPRIRGHQAVVDGGRRSEAQQPQEQQRERNSRRSVEHF